MARPPEKLDKNPASHCLETWKENQLTAYSTTFDLCFLQVDMEAEVVAMEEVVIVVIQEEEGNSSFITFCLI